MAHPRRVPTGLLALVLVISMVISPAYAAKPSPTTGGTLTGKATIAGTRTAVAGASVTAVGSAGTFTATTGANGTYSLPGLAAGPYTVTCAAAGFQAQQLTATVRDGSKTTLNFALTPAVATTGSLSGTVTGPDGVGIDGASVRTLAGGYSALTGPDGTYRIDDMAAGTYDVLAAATGYADAMKQASITVGTTTSLDFALAASTLAITSLEASPSAFTEGMESTVTLSATFTGSAAGHTWSQVSGPKAPITDVSANSAIVDVGAIEVAAETSLVFSLTLTDAAGVSTSGMVTVDVIPADLTPILGPNVQIGGSTYAATHAAIGGVEWAFFNVGAAFKATQVGTTAGLVYTLNLAGIVYDIDIVERDAVTYALVACGNAGVAVVNVSDPTLPVLVSITPVNYYQGGIIFCDTGGTISYDNVIQSGSAPICALETDGTDLYIADNDFGFHKTALANLFGATGPVLEADGTLLIDAEKYTLQWAGEKAWGGPISLKLRGERLFVGMGALGLGIFDTVSLEQVGRYNLFTDVARTEDYFGALDLSLAVHSDELTGDLYLDDFTGMPDYRQVQFEVYEINKGNLIGVPTPWADFEREGQWYYGAADVDVAQYAERTIAFVAYSLGGIVAVDVTGCESASAASFLNAPYLGYFPAVPVNGPYDTGSNPSSLLPYEGAGMLKESGVTAVRVSGEKVLATDHFAGLMILDGASAPETWQGSAPPYDNNTDGIADNDVPDFEDITTYNMSPYDQLDNESLPVAFYEWPCQLATRELMGHGYGLSLFEPMALETAGNVDVLECSSAGGFVFVDVKSLTAPLMEDRFEILGYFPTTSEIGADVNGAPTETMAIGHASGISVSNGYLYLSDGPHGISAWNITDALGFMTDDIHVVGNTVQDEYPQQAADGTWVYPPSHTVRNVIDLARGVTWAMCVGNGMRRTPIAEIESGLGTAGAPKLMALGRSDLFEHNSDEFSLKVFPYQDSAYDVEFRGNYAYVADGARGLTIYDVSKDPAVKSSGFFVANVGWNKGMPQLGTCSGIEMWQDPATSRIYAVLACGPYGVGVVDVTDPMAMRIVKVFEPIKIEDGDIAVADGQAIDVEVIGDKAYYAYDSFGVLCYAISDLIAPLPDGVVPTNLFLKNTLGTVIYDYRPWHLGNFKLQLVPGYEDVDGGAVRMEYTEQAGKLNIYAAFGHAGLVKIDFTDPAAPALVQRIDTNVECVDVAISGGRIYCADGPGGMVFFK